MSTIPELFGSLVFGDEAMKQRLPKDIYKSLHKTITDGTELDITVANAVASAMKDWATEKGATHYTHWFQPLTGITAEKHDSFISPQPDGKVIMEFSGKELIKGEPDASSFPSGGLRATFEARGYTAWDPTSYAFIKDDSLCIPTVFCAYSGEILDKKTPLLRSMQLVSDKSVAILRLFGDTETNRVTPSVGPEQEYFLIDKKLFDKRKDLKFTGRTLFGAKPPKGQELDDHYFGSIKPRVMEYMRDLNIELWKLGIYAKTEHNEVAPSQHELAPVYTSVNVATDQNQLTMDIMKRVAEKHGLACLLHEKPFDGVNGSGKHNNWSLCTDGGVNLLDPTKDPSKNMKFLLFLSAVIEAVDEYQDLLRVTVASAANDHRLGASEAPPAIVSMYLGDELMTVLESIENGVAYDGRIELKMYTGVNVLPDFQKDTTDRNRTSPMAFTGNKFEFRMLGSSFSIADVNIILNTIVAKSLDGFAQRLSAAKDFDAEVIAIIRDTFVAHKRIIFNGNNYSEEWVAQAEERGLLNLRTTVDALSYLMSDRNISLFESYRVLSRTEINARYEVMLENYHKVLGIETMTMLDMARRDIAPAVYGYMGELARMLSDAANAGMLDVNGAGKALYEKLFALNVKLNDCCDKLEAAHEKVDACGDSFERAKLCRDSLIPCMNALRAAADELESAVAAKYWPFPTYGELLFSV